jgi:hypothetical protein
VADVALRVEGLDAFRKELRNLGTDRYWTKELGKANQKSAAVVAKEVGREAPRGATGNLAKSARALKSATKAQVAYGTNARVPYAGPINFGWAARNIAPQEALYSSIQSTEKEYLEIYWEALSDVSSRAFPSGRL